jgi:hypothetical protein
MYQSTAMTVLATSLLAPFAAQWQQKLTPVLEQIAQLIGSFFGGGALARQHAGL